MKYAEFAQISRDVLVKLGLPGIELVHKLIVMIAAHESAYGKYSKQINGPALGLTQIEPATHDYIWDQCEGIEKYAAKFGFTRDVKQLETNPAYCVFVTRMRIKMDPVPLPSTVEAMADWAKKHWNTEDGKATADDYRKAFLTWPMRRGC